MSWMIQLPHRISTQSRGKHAPVQSGLGQIAHLGQLQRSVMWQCPCMHCKRAALQKSCIQLVSAHHVHCETSMLHPLASMHALPWSHMSWAADAPLHVRREMQPAESLPCH